MRILVSGWARIAAILALAVWAGAASAQIADINSAINKAGRQRMLSQRMAKFYQAIGWGVGDGASSGELEKARKEFIAAHEELRKAGGESGPLKESLERVGRQWIFFDAALGQRGGDRRSYFATDVAAASELILQEMETAVGLFEKLPK